METFPCALFHILDCMGYSQDMISIRRNVWRKINVGRNARYQAPMTMRSVVVGSKAEGITSFYQSDVDNMLLRDSIICTSDISSVYHLPNTKVFYTDMRDAPPGYTRLKLVKENGPLVDSVTRESEFTSEAGEVYLSSSLFLSYVKRTMRTQNYLDQCLPFCGTAGPAVSAVGLQPQDLVVAFHCYCPELLHAWASRPRHHNWPPADVIQAASSMLAQVVPTGSKGSDDQWREWRFCFIESELTLTQSLNETQLKLYILLKMVAKEILHEICGEISSYIMKNVTYWLSELLPGYVFRKENLFSLLIVALDLPKSAIRENFLPYYMIPERNLLAERLTPNSRLRLNKLIEQLIKEGPRFVLRCSRLRAAMIIRVNEPAILVRYGEFRNSVEISLALFMTRLLASYPVDLSAILAASNEVVLKVLPLPEFYMLLARRVPPDIISGMVLERIATILS